MRCIRGGGLRTLLSALLVCSTILLTRPALAQDAKAPAGPALSPGYTQDLVPLTSPLSSIFAKAIFGPYVIFSDFFFDEFDILKAIYDSTPIGLKLQMKAPLSGFQAFDGAPSSNGVHFVGVNPLGVGVNVEVGLEHLFGTNTKMIDLTQITLTGVNASQGLSVVGSPFGDYVIVSFKDQAALVHFAFMDLGHFLLQTLPGIPVNAAWTQAGVAVLFKNPNGLIFIPKQGSATVHTFPFTPNKSAFAPNGHFFVSDGVAAVIHELTWPDLTEVTQYTVRSQAYALTFLTAQLLLFAYLPNTLALLDLTGRTETDFTLQPTNLQLLDLWYRPGFFPPRILVDAFDPISQKGLVYQVTISGLDFDSHYVVQPALRRNPAFIQWVSDVQSEPKR